MLRGHFAVDLRVNRIVVCKNKFNKYTCWGINIWLRAAPNGTYLYERPAFSLPPRLWCATTPPWKFNALLQRKTRVARQLTRRRASTKEITFGNTHAQPSLGFYVNFSPPLLSRAVDVNTHATTRGRPTFAITLAGPRHWAQHFLCTAALLGRFPQTGAAL